MVSEGFIYSYYLDFGKNMKIITMAAIAMGLEIPRLRKLLHSRLVTKMVKSSGSGMASRVEWNGVLASYHGAVISVDISRRVLFQSRQALLDM